MTVDGQKPKRPKRKVSEAWLERAAVHYLGRYAATEARLRDVLARKISRRNEDGASPTDDQKAMIDAVVTKCIGYGYVNDVGYASQRVGSLIRKGKAPRMVAQDLRHKGVSQEVVEQALADAEADADDGLMLKAAAALVKRRRFGPFRRADRNIDGKADKEMAALMRAGFPYGVAKQVLEMAEEEILTLMA